MGKKQNLEQNDEILHDGEISKIAKLLYAFVMLGAAVIIYILFEKIASLNFYFIYASLGLIVGLSVILIFQSVMRKNWPY